MPTNTLKQVAEHYAVPVGRVRAWIRQGELVAIDVSKKRGSLKPRLVVSDATMRDFERTRSTRAEPKTVRRKSFVGKEYV